MNVHAKISREWRDRMIIILIMLIGSAAWFYYDALVTYPNYNVKADAYAELKEKFSSDEKVLEEKWKALAVEKNWDAEDVPKHPKDIDQQYRWGTGLLIVGLLFLIWMIREAKRIITADDKVFIGIKTAFPPFNNLVPVEFASVIGIDRHRWEKKGIAKIFYKDKQGNRRQALIDDYKYAGSEKILLRCEEIIAQKKEKAQTHKAQN